MILVDANLLIYAWNESSPQHVQARPWLEDRLSGPSGVGLPWASLHAFVRLVTNPRIFSSPAAPREAWAQVEEWLSLKNVFSPEPAARYRSILGELMSHVSHPNLVPDAHLAALAMEYGLTLQSTDGDFARFPGLRWENPLG